MSLQYFFLADSPLSNDNLHQTENQFFLFALIKEKAVVQAFPKVMDVCAKLWGKCFGSGEGMLTGKKSLTFHSHVLLPLFFIPNLTVSRRPVCYNTIA